MTSHVSDPQLQGEVEPHYRPVSVWASKFSAEPVSFQLMMFVVFYCNQLISYGI
jgi:hypothetical protein